MAGTTLGTAYVQIVPSAEGIKGSITNVLGGEAETAGTAVGTKIGGFAKKALAMAGVAAGVALVAGIKGAIDEGAKLQQSYLGGLDTLYGDAADQARQFAREASKFGVSMNDYSEQAVSFGAALKAAYGGDTTKAVKAANTAIMDMADNAAKMGTPLESIQNAYQGFAKQNYTMLDNLKLGYGGTKQEMERLLKDAQKFSGIKYDINNLGDVYEAIHVIQGELNLTGVAAEEASETFSGSFGAMKAAAQNVLGSLALGENIQPALTELLKSVDTFVFKNLIPMIGTIIKGLPQVIVTFIQQGIPTLLSRISTLVANLAASLTSKANTITADKVKVWAQTTIPKLLKSAGELIGKFASGLVTNLPKIIIAVGKIGLEIVKGLGSAIWPKIKEAANGIKERFLAPIRAIRDTISGVVNSIKEKFLAPINALKDRVKSIIDKIKGFFKFTVSKPHIPTPHFSVSPPGWKLGDLLKGSLPKLGISWYAKGGIATSPVIGVGEAGPEAILPLDPFWKKMDKIVENTQGGDITINVYATPGMDINALAEAVERKMTQMQKRRAIAWGTI